MSTMSVLKNGAGVLTTSATKASERETARHRKAEVIRMRRQSMSFDAIGKELGISRQRAHTIYKAALNDITAMGVHELRKEAAERLEELRSEAHAVLKTRHPLVAAGAVVYEKHPVAMIDDEGEPYIEWRAGDKPLEDAGPKLAAIDVLRKLEERWAKLWGLDAPVKIDHSGSVDVRYEVHLPDNLRERLT